MNKYSRKPGLCVPVAAAVILLTGCATQSPPLYQWTGYQPAVYDYLNRGKAPQEQIDALENALEEIQSKGHTPPPGFHAQLGMLYASTGNAERAMREFGAEKELFPESAPYMDFLTKKSQ